jgi:hypothetical protein
MGRPSLALGAGVYVTQSESSDALAIANAKLEPCSGDHPGRAARRGKAKLERDKAQLIFEVELWRDGIVMEVESMRRAAL